jgi:hypothetical protein
MNEEEFKEQCIGDFFMYTVDIGSFESIDWWFELVGIFYDLEFLCFIWAAF